MYPLISSLKIVGRYCQEGSIKSVCDAFDRKNCRKALLIMTTGSGKTRMVIADEVQWFIYNKYRDIFHYFDAPLVELTATPKDEIDENTYGIFELENGISTYDYDLAQAVKAGFLVDFLSVETTLKFIEEGIVYEDISEEDWAVYKDIFDC